MDDASAYHCCGCDLSIADGAPALILSPTSALNLSGFWAPIKDKDINGGSGWMCHANAECLTKMVVSRFDVDPLLLLSTLAKEKPNAA